MKEIVFVLCILGLLAPHQVSAADLSVNELGIQVAAGSLGEFTLSFPQLEPVHKIIEVKASGTQATVRYEGGGECTVRINKEEIELTFKSIPKDVQKWRIFSLIDIGFAKGGSWRIAESEGVFPAEKSPIPQFASMNGDSFLLRNAQGQSLTFRTPEYAFQQLTDNREWNWAIYQWQFFVPMEANKSTLKISVASDLSAKAKLIDEFGQSLKDDFANKLKSIHDLKNDLEEDEAYYASIDPPKRDRFGGLPGSQDLLGLKRIGFFHIEKKGEKSWLVDPDGNAFFHLGICGFAPSDDYTYVKGREDIYTWLPKADGEFASAFRASDGDANFSFYLANTIRKFGSPYDYATHTQRMIDRVKKWGFNSIGAFSPAPSQPIPYVAHLPINEWEGVPRIPGLHEVWDPFDAITAAKIAENMSRELPLLAKDPQLIGWFIVNEPRYDVLPSVIPSLSGKHACKQKFVAMLKSKYRTIDSYNTAWNSNAESFEELIDVGLAITTATAKEDIKSFVGTFLETYFAQISRIYRKYDPNHLLLGSRLQPITIEDEQLCRIMGRYLDVVSYNYYTYAVDKVALKRYYEWTNCKPIMLSEFFWSSPKDSGLVGGRELGNQQERGLAYRNYVEQTASLGFVVGIEWFTLIDQATTGRWFNKYNGESYNTGLISVADRPWKEMLSEMMKTNYGIYDLLMERRPPFSWNDRRVQAP